VSTIDAKALRQISADDSAALPADTVADLSPTTDSATGVDLQLRVRDTGRPSAAGQRHGLTFSCRSATWVDFQLQVSDMGRPSAAGQRHGLTFSCGSATWVDLQLQVSDTG